MDESICVNCGGEQYHHTIECYLGEDVTPSPLVGVLRDRIAFERKAAQHRMHLTAFGVGTLAFLAGFGVCWLSFVR